MEACDYKTLDRPEKNILDGGGYIAIALYDGKPVGTCALLIWEMIVSSWQKWPYLSLLKVWV